MKLCAALLILLVSVATATAQVSSRFTRSLGVAELKEAGLDRLNSDQAAVLDALVRRDAGTNRTEDEKVAANFSQRLTADERKNCGLAQLTAAELARADALVERYESAILARQLLAAPPLIARSRTVNPEEAKPSREIHGTFSLSYGWGKGGYSEKSGSMVVRMEDPAHGLTVSVGYAETQLKGAGGYIYRDDVAPPMRAP
jgi:hypothetical protein